MRQLILMRGAPGSGKSTFIRDTGLEAYTLEPDTIRLLFQGPVMGLSGAYGVPQQNDSRVWDFLYERLEERMQRGELVVIDAMHAHEKAFGKYKELCQKYRYRCTVVDFSDVPIDECKRRNTKRYPTFKVVPEEIIDKAYAGFALKGTPGWVNVVKPSEFREFFAYTPTDVSNYKKLVFFGDLQGCYDPLKQYFDENPYNPETLYIFVGDLLDRGPQNGEVMAFMLSLYSRKNVVIVEGNHERHFRKWAHDEEVNSSEFTQYTQPQLEAVGISKKEVRELSRKLYQCHFINFHGTKFMVTHGGLPKMPDNLLYLHSAQMIKGVGKYEDDIDAAWDDSMQGWDPIYQVHGHRNEFSHPVDRPGRSINLEGSVEFGGALRIVEVTPGEDKPNFLYLEFQNNHVDGRFLPPAREELDGLPLIAQLRRNPLVIEKKYGNVCSFSFSKEAYYGRLWDRQTITARGLFINEVTGEIVSRSYNKFFNVGEREETRLHALKDSFAFPVAIYDKPNGYLGIVGYDAESDELFVSSKSTPEGNFAKWFREILESKLGETGMAELHSVCKNWGVTATFEVIDPVRDPHIVEYLEPQVILLDLVKRQEAYEKFPYDRVKYLAYSLGIPVKAHVGTLDTWAEFRRWYDGQMVGWDETREGYVIEDAKGFMTKVKLPYYTFWKQVRSMTEGMALRGQEYRLPAHCQTSQHLVVYAWLKTLPREELKLDLITLRKRFLTSREGRDEAVVS